MAQQLRQLNNEEDENGEDDEDMGEDDEEQMIDIDNLNDNEKAILLQYLHDEYQKNPDNLPMSKELVEQFLDDNKDLLNQLLADQQQDDDDGEDNGEDYDDDQVPNQAMVIQGDDNLPRTDEEDEDEEDGMQAPGGADDEEFDDGQQQQMINPAYQLEDFQERDQEGNLIQHSLNVNTHNAQLANQYQMMLLQQQ